jgi:hypothetical protein
VFTLVVTVMLGLVMTPWLIRNHSLFGLWVPVSTSGGANLWMGNNPATTGFYQEPPARPAGVNEAQQDRALKDLAVDYIAREPVSFAVRTLVKAARLYERETIGVVWNEEGLKQSSVAGSVAAIKALSQAYWMLMLVLFIAGCWIAARNDLLEFVFHPAVAIVAYSTLFYAVFVIQDRYHVPTNPLLAIFAALAVSRLLSWLGYLSDGAEPRSRAAQPA